VSEDALVCPHCGQNLKSSPAPGEKQAAKQASGLQTAGLVLGAIGIVVLIGTGISMAEAGRFLATAEDLVSGVGGGFIGLGLFFAGVLCFLLARTSKS